MCGRYRLAKDWSEIERRFGATLATGSAARADYNIAPTDEVVAIRRQRDSGVPEAGLLRWGLIPRWATDTRSGAKMINAKGALLETCVPGPGREPPLLDPGRGLLRWRKADGGVLSGSTSP